MLAYRILLMIPLLISVTKIWRIFEINYMKLNTLKCHPIVSDYKHEQVSPNIGKDIIRESNDGKPLRITIERDVKFDKHLLELCSKANQILSACSRIATLFSFNKRRIIFKNFVESQFKYCPIVWLFHSRHTNNKIDRLHEKTCRIVYDIDVSTFNQLLDMDKSFCIHHQNKALHDYSGNSSKKIFVRRESTVKLRFKPVIVIPLLNSVLQGKKSLRHLDSIIWNSLPIKFRADHSIFFICNKNKTMEINCLPMYNLQKLHS